MEEKKRRDMEAMKQKNRDRIQQQLRQPNLAKQTKKIAEVETKGKTNLGSKPTMSKVQQSRSETASAGAKKVAFDSDTITASKTMLC